MYKDGPGTSKALLSTLVTLMVPSIYPPIPLFSIAGTPIPVVSGQQPGLAPRAPDGPNYHET